MGCAGDGVSPGRLPRSVPPSPAALHPLPKAAELERRHGGRRRGRRNYNGRQAKRAVNAKRNVLDLTTEGKKVVMGTLQLVRNRLAQL